MLLYLPLCFHLLAFNFCILIFSSVHASHVCAEDVLPWSTTVVYTPGSSQSTGRGATYQAVQMGWHSPLIPLSMLRISPRSCFVHAWTASFGSGGGANVFPILSATLPKKPFSCGMNDILYTSAAPSQLSHALEGGAGNVPVPTWLELDSQNDPHKRPKDSGAPVIPPWLFTAALSALGASPGWCAALSSAPELDTSEDASFTRSSPFEHGQHCRARPSRQR